MKKITETSKLNISLVETILNEEKDPKGPTRRLRGTGGTILHPSETQIARLSGFGRLTPSGADELGPIAQKLQKKAASKVDVPKFGKGARRSVTTQREEISLIEKILGEEKCGKGMYWCNTNKECKPLPSGFNTPGQKIKPTEVGIGKPVEGSCTHTKKGKSCPVHGTHQCPMSEEKDPKGPVKSYKSPEELAKKHGVSVEEIKKQLEIGTKVEFEHTTSKSSARITALQHLDEKPDYYTKLKKMETQKESNNRTPEQKLVDKILGEIQEASKSGDDDLRDWFRKSSGTNPKTGKKVSGWVQLGGEFAGAPCAKQPGQTTKPKCGSSKMASEMSPEEEEKAAARKRKEDPNPDRKGEAINVKTESKIHESHKEIASGKKKDREGYMARTQLDTINKAVVSLKKNIKKGDTQLPAWVQSKITKAADYIDTAADYLDSDEMSEGKKDACYTKVKSRYSVWPSAYASGALVKCRKVGAANWGNKTNEDVTIEDLEGNTFVEVVDLIRPESITGFKSQVEEATRLQADTGNIIAVILSWRGKIYSVRMFFPQVGMPNRKDVTTEIQKIYPGALVLQYKVSSLQPGMPLIQVVNSKSKNYLLNIGTIGEEKIEEVAAWQRKEGKNPEGGLNAKGRASAKAQGHNLKPPVTTPPSKLDPDSKSAKRRKSFCARMGGMPGPMKDEKGRPTRKALSLRKWNC